MPQFIVGLKTSGHAAWSLIAILGIWHDRLLYISGQIPVDREGNVPSDFAAQCRLAWANIAAQLRAADMSLDNLVKVTVFLADRRHALENSRILREVLGEHAPALTVVISGIYDESWLLEIEAIAAE
jgi:2-iminobutanoate/2-iminopropanoate deaminase